MQELIDQLKNAGIENPVHELRILINHILGDEKIILLDEALLDQQKYETLKAFVLRRAQHEPIAKIVGYKYFWKDKFVTNKYTLDPRPESEFMIEAVLKYFPDKNYPYKILDLGTGTGCLILSVLKEFPNASGVAVDISEEALKVAAVNAKDLSIEKISFLKSSWFEKVDKEAFDIILCNPPYIPYKDTGVNPDAMFDPKSALYSDDDGLKDIKEILKSAEKYLGKEISKLFLEIGYGQLKAVESIVDYNNLKLVDVINDLQKIPRILIMATFP